MVEDRKNIKIIEEEFGEIHISTEVVAIIAGLAATEVKGVSAMRGDITNELVSKLGGKNLSKGVKVEIKDESVDVDLHLIIDYGISIPKVAEAVQEKVKSAVETMTGLNVKKVHIRIANVDMKNNK